MLRNNDEKRNINLAFLIPPPSSYWHPIYFPPNRVNSDDFSSNAKLLSSYEIDLVRQYREIDKQNNEQAKDKSYYSKHELNANIRAYVDHPINIKYSIIFSPQNDNMEDMYAVYPLVIGEGSFGKVKLCQNLNAKEQLSTDWIVKKSTASNVHDVPKKKISIEERDSRQKKLTPYQKLPLLKLFKPKANVVNNIIIPEKNKAMRKASTIQASANTEKKGSICEKNTSYLHTIISTDAYVSSGGTFICKATNKNDNKIKGIHGEGYAEYRILKKVYHHSQISYFERKRPLRGQQENILMPLIENSITLEDLLLRNAKINKSFTIREGLLIGLRFLKECYELIIEKKILHLDLKPGNIMVNEETNMVKLIDFNVSVVLNGKKNCYQEKSVLVRGTPAYADPSFLPHMLKLNPEIVAKSLVEFNSNKILYLFNYPNFLAKLVNFWFHPIKDKTFNPDNDVDTLEILNYVNKIMTIDAKASKLLAKAIFAKIKEDSDIGRYLKSNGHPAFINSGIPQEITAIENSNIDSRILPNKYIIYSEQTELYSIGLVLHDIWNNTEEANKFFLPQMKKIINKLRNIDPEKRGSIKKAIKAWTKLTTLCLRNEKIITEENMVKQAEQFINGIEKKEMHLDCNKFIDFINAKKQPDFNDLKNKKIVLVGKYQTITLDHLLQIKEIFKNEGIQVKNQIKIITSDSLRLSNATKRLKISPSLEITAPIVMGSKLNGLLYDKINQPSSDNELKQKSKRKNRISRILHPQHTSGAQILSQKKLLEANQINKNNQVKSSPTLKETSVAGEKDFRANQPPLKFRRYENLHRYESKRSQPVDSNHVNKRTHSLKLLPITTPPEIKNVPEADSISSTPSSSGISPANSSSVFSSGGNSPDSTSQISPSSTTTDKILTSERRKKFTRSNTSKGYGLFSRDNTLAQEKIGPTNNLSAKKQIT